MVFFSSYAIPYQSRRKDEKNTVFSQFVMRALIFQLNGTLTTAESVRTAPGHAFNTNSLFARLFTQYYNTIITFSASYFNKSRVNKSDFARPAE